MSAPPNNVVPLRRPPPGLATEPSVSVIIPVMADGEALARLLTSLRDLPAEPDEIVVVDGGGSAGCRSLARRFRCVYLATRPGRGHQLHAGALRASGDVLWFLHADTEVPANAVTLIRERQREGAVGGYFTFRFAGPPGWHKTLLAQAINWRTRHGIPYDNQGLFATRTAYDAVGGFADLPLFEEVTLVRGLRALGSFSAVAASIGVSPRQWERDGWVRRSLVNRLLAVAHLLGVPPRRLARSYRPVVDVDDDPPSSGANSSNGTDPW